MKNILLTGLTGLSLIGCNIPTERVDGYDIHGIDVSHHQGVVNWDTVVTQNIDFAFVKATEGEGFQDSCFLHNWTELKRVGIRRGAYHFFYPVLSVQEQVDNFIRTVELIPGDLPPVVDFEVTNRMVKREIIERLELWLVKIEGHYNIRPIIYTNQKLFNQYLSDKFDDYPLWIARYNTIPPLTVDRREWKFWQYGNRGRLKGVEGYVDLNVFYGNLIELEGMTVSPETDTRNLPYSVLVE